eukprot:scaffold11797_cov123-Isochrysis_galbana.AAC.3
MWARSRTHVGMCILARPIRRASERARPLKLGWRAATAAAAIIGRACVAPGYRGGLTTATGDVRSTRQLLCVHAV